MQLDGDGTRYEASSRSECRDDIDRSLYDKVVATGSVWHCGFTSAYLKKEA